jgi:hypothetical protein
MQILPDISGMIDARSEGVDDDLTNNLSRTVGEDKEMGPLLGRHLAEQMTEEELTQHRLPAMLAYWQLYHRRAHIELAIEPWKGRYGSGALGAKIVPAHNSLTTHCLALTQKVVVRGLRGIATKSALLAAVLHLLCHRERVPRLWRFGDLMLHIERMRMV